MAMVMDMDMAMVMDMKTISDFLLHDECIMGEKVKWGRI